MTNLHERHRSTLTVEEAAALLGISPPPQTNPSVGARSRPDDSIDASSFSATNSTVSSACPVRAHARVARAATDAPLDASG